MRCRFVRLVTAALMAALLMASCGSNEQAIAPTADPAQAPEIAFATEDAPASADPTNEDQGNEDPTDEEPLVAEEPADDPAVGDGLFPTVVDAVARNSSGSAWRFDVTLLSEYDSPARYADAWRVLDANDNELGIRVLGHDHANEQPFTRSHTIDVPAGTTVVFVEGRDQVNGWSGERFELELTR